MRIFFDRVIALVLATAALFLLSDLYYGARLLMLDQPTIFDVKDDGWYELTPGFQGFDRFGPEEFPVFISPYGTRQESAVPFEEFDVVFLGDSFTYGVNGPWDETFVGMYAKDSGNRVLNGGVSSYSPTPYAFQYSQFLAAGILPENHVVVLALDFSDVQDEATRWIWPDEGSGDSRPIPGLVREKPDFGFFRGLLDELDEELENNFPLSYRFSQGMIRASLSDEDRLERVAGISRSAFTWKNWSDLDKPEARYSQSYHPLGVSGGLDKISDRVQQISDMAKAHQAELFILVYPWPAQIVHEDHFDWSEWVGSVCEASQCDGVIDTIPTFRGLALNNAGWYPYYFLEGDVHFTEAGNRVVADALLATLPNPDGPS